jgi:hypothetical protein
MEPFNGNRRPESGLWKVAVPKLFHPTVSSALFEPGFCNCDTIFKEEGESVGKSFCLTKFQEIQR